MSVKCILTEQGGKGGGTSAISVQSISVVSGTAPSLSYYYGQSASVADMSGLQIEVAVGQSGLIVSRQTIDYDNEHLSYSLNFNTARVIVTYTQGSTSVSTAFSFTARPVLQSIAVTTSPTVNYEKNETFDDTGMVVTGTYFDGINTTTSTVTGYSMAIGGTVLNNSYVFTTVTSTPLIATVTYDGDAGRIATGLEAVTTTFEINVVNATVNRPTWRGNIDYVKNTTQSINNSDYWNNWSNVAWSMGGTTSGENAGTYSVRVTLNEGYSFKDSSDPYIDIDWGINPIAPSLSASPTSVAINASNYNAGVNVTVSYDGDGIISASLVDNTNANAIILTNVDSTTFKITGTNGQAGTATLKISASAGRNYTAAADVNVPIAATYLSSVKVTTAPSNLEYYNGESFDPTGLVLTATYGDGTTKTIYAGASGLKYEPGPLTDGTTAVTIKYTENGLTVQTTQAITVKPVLSSIEVTTPPTKTTYEYGDAFATAGMVVTATYSDGSTKAVTPSSISPANGATLNTVGTQTISVGYKDDSISSAKTTSTSVTVTRKKVSKPTWKGDSSAPTYSNSTINVNSATYWNNWNTTYFSYTGCSATGAGTHTATFTPNANYQWSDGTTTAIDVNWTIKQKTPTLSVSPTSITINASNYSSGVTATITYDGDGTLKAESSNSTIASVTGSGTKNLTIKGNGSTAGSATITISATAGTNYGAVTSVTITVTAAYWSFGGGTADSPEAVDAAWFTGLKNYLASNSASSDWVGVVKQVTLTAAVSGTTGSVSWDTGWTSGSTVNIVVVDVNHDASNSVTFQTLNGSPTAMRFGAGSVASPSGSNYDENATKWGNSACCARDACKKFYDAFPGKSAIKEVTKVTNTVISGTSMANTQDYVWLPSYDEVGLESYTYNPAGDEYTSGGTQSAFKYYTDNNSRIKKNGDSGSAYIWWLRSRYTYTAYHVGNVRTSGAGYRSSYWDTYRLAPAFVIG